MTSHRRRSCAALLVFAFTRPDRVLGPSPAGICRATRATGWWRIGWPTPAAAEVSCADSITRATAPIQLPGDGGVSDTGEAKRPLPLSVPAGPQGMQPALSIEYDGGGGNGRLGAGMSLSGLSAIVPCAQHVRLGGHRGRGRLRPDRQLLPRRAEARRVRGSGLPATGERELHGLSHLLESFSRIVADFATDAAQPTGFTAYDPDGTIRTYGPRFASRFAGLDARKAVLDESNEVAYIYLLDKVEDRDGNRIRYVYEDADSAAPGEVSYRILRIDYSYAGGLSRGARSDSATAPAPTTSSAGSAGSRSSIARS